MVSHNEDQGCGCTLKYVKVQAIIKWVMQVKLVWAEYLKFAQDKIQPARLYLVGPQVMRRFTS